MDTFFLRDRLKERKEKETAMSVLTVRNDLKLLLQLSLSF